MLRVWTFAWRWVRALLQPLILVRQVLDPSSSRFALRRTEEAVRLMHDDFFSSRRGTFLRMLNLKVNKDFKYGIYYTVAFQYQFSAYGASVPQTQPLKYTYAILDMSLKRDGDGKLRIYYGKLSPIKEKSAEYQLVGSLLGGRIWTSVMESNPVLKPVISFYLLSSVICPRCEQNDIFEINDWLYLRPKPICYPHTSCIML